MDRCDVIIGLSILSAIILLVVFIAYSLTETSHDRLMAARYAAEHNCVLVGAENYQIICNGKVQRNSGR